MEERRKQQDGPVHPRRPVSLGKVTGQEGGAVLPSPEAAVQRTRGTDRRRPRENVLRIGDEDSVAAGTARRPDWQRWRREGPEVSLKGLLASSRPWPSLCPGVPWSRPLATGEEQTWGEGRCRETSQETGADRPDGSEHATVEMRNTQPDTC